MKSKFFVRVLAMGVLLVLPACSPSCLMTPGDAFSEQEAPPAPDYSRSESWAALPFENDNADLTPPGYEDRQSEAQADVFFVHPTTFFERDRWNASIDHQKSREFVDQMVMSGQASAFNGCCSVYAPRYRQATIGTYFADREDAAGAFGLAYDDVERAFEFFLDEYNAGRPFILASHSQGSQHAMRLLERIDGDLALRERLIAAYIPGFTHPMSRYNEVYEHLEPCESSTQTGCISAWDTYKNDADIELPDRPVYWRDGNLASVGREVPRQCTNPLVWTTLNKRAKSSEHAGAVKPIYPEDKLSFFSIMFSSDPLGFDINELSEPRSELIWSECREQGLRVPDLEDLGYSATETTPGNYHLLDYRLFYMDVRQNAIERTEAWLDDHQATE